MSLKDTFKKLRRPPATQDLSRRHVLKLTRRRAFPSLSQWRHLPSLLSPRERWVFLGALIVFVGSLATLGGHLVLSHETVVPADGGEYVEALVGAPQFVNPLYASVNDVDADLTHLVFSGLMKYDQDHGLVPDLAESVDLSNDGKTYTFVLRQGATWQNGDPVTVSDVLSTFAMIQNPEYKSPLYGAFKGVQASQVDDRTVQFALPAPSTRFLTDMTVGIMSSNVWDAVPAKSATLAETNLEPIGTGPYKFEKFSKDKLGNILSYTLLSNPNYYATSAHITRITFQFYPDIPSAMDAVKKKVVDGLGFVPEDQLGALQNDHDIHLLFPSLPEETGLFFNQNHQPLLKDAALRKALSESIDRDQLIATALQGHGTAVASPLLPGSLGADPTVAEPSYDLASAKSALDADGWKLTDGSTTRSKGSTELKLTITVLDTPEFDAVANYVKQQWTALGVNVTLTTTDTNTYQSTIKGRAYDVLLSTESVGADADPYPFWHSSQVSDPGLNVALYANKDVDKALEAGRAATSGDARSKAYGQFAQTVVNDLPAIFLYEPTYAYALGADVKGANIGKILSPADRFANVSAWYINTKHVLQ